MKNKKNYLGTPLCRCVGVCSYAGRAQKKSVKLFAVPPV
jgi:hypothetical protein